MINSQIKSPIGNPDVIKIWKFFSHLLIQSFGKVTAET